jgi:hypothetical protein
MNQSPVLKTPLHDWLQPRLEAVLQQALAAGFQRDAVIAVLTDLVTAPPLNREPRPDTNHAVRP